MYTGLVRLVPQKCSTCGYNPVRPISHTKETQTEVIVEATWQCPHCGSKFANGIVSRTEKINEQQK